VSAALVPPYLAHLPTPPRTTANTADYVVITANHILENLDVPVPVAEQMNAIYLGRSSMLPAHIVTTVMPNAVCHFQLSQWSSGYEGFNSPIHTALASLCKNVAVVGFGGTGTDLIAYVDAASGTAPAPSAVAGQIQRESLINAVRSIFPDAALALSNQSDPEEGWTRPLLTVDTGIEDPEKFSELERKFYEEIEGHETLTAALNAMTVLLL
jgi:hypothetical protein